MTKMIEALYVEHMGDDLSVVNAARVTMGVTREEFTDRDKGLINFLAREQHKTPFCHPHVTFRCKAPIAIARQLGKHQVGFRWNEMSRRYKDGAVECFIPETVLSRPENLHSGSAEPLNDGELEFALGTMEIAYSFAENAYRELLDAGVAPEQARFVLPQGMITEWVWTGSLYGWFDVWRQRSAPGAQYEVRLFAEEIDTQMTELYPISWQALKDSVK